MISKAEATNVNLAVDGLESRIKALEGLIAMVETDLTRTAGHRMMQVANPARELLNKIKREKNRIWQSTQKTPATT